MRPSTEKYNTAYYLSPSLSLGTMRFNSLYTARISFRRQSIALMASKRYAPCPFRPLPVGSITSMWFLLVFSRVCAVAQYAVLKANAKVNGRGPFSHPHASETPQPISMSCQIYYYVPQGRWRAKFGWNRFGRYGSAHAWKNTVCVDFFINISVHLCICLFVSSSGLQVTVLGRF